MPGDCGPAGLSELLAQGPDVRAKVLVAPHHASDKSFWPDFYRAVNPDVALVSCGFQNRYGHPGKKVRDWFERRYIPLLTTVENGQIRLEFPPDASVRTVGAKL